VARQAILIATSDEHRLDAWYGLLRHGGYWPLPAPTLTRARWWVDKIRPGVVLIDAQLVDGRGADLLQTMRTLPPLAAVPALVLGALTAQEHGRMAGDPSIVLWPREQIADDTLARLLTDALSGARTADDASPPSQTGQQTSAEAAWPRPAPADV